MKIFKNMRLRQDISKIKKMRDSGQEYISYILDNILDLNNPEILQLFVEAVNNGQFNDDMMYVFLEYNQYSKIFYENDSLFEHLVDYFSHYINDILSIGSINLRFFDKRFFSNPKLVERVMKKLNISEIGDKLLETIIPSLYNYENISKVELLKRLGYKINEDIAFDSILKSSDYSLYNIEKYELVTPSLVDRMYKYKFDLFKEWCKSDYKTPMPKFEIPIDFEPSLDNKLANYWRSMDLIIMRHYGRNVSALEVVMPYVKEFAKSNKCTDPFSERDVEDIYNEWVEIHYYFPRKEIRDRFYKDLDTNAGRLFDSDGIPKDFLFSDDYRLGLLRKITCFNYEGGARYSKSYPDYDLIEFLLANIDRIPKEYRFIFDKLKEFKTNQNAIRDFLLIMTDSHRMTKGNRLYDENGFNEKFYEALLIGENIYTIDVIDPSWRSHFSDNEIGYMKKYKRDFPRYFLRRYYDEERKHSHDIDQTDERFHTLTDRELIKYYFEDGKPNLLLMEHLLFDVSNRNMLTGLEDCWDLFSAVEKAYLNFLIGVGFDKKFNLNRQEVNEFFDENGPKLVFCQYLFDKNEYEAILITKLPYSKVLDSKSTLIVDGYAKIDDDKLKPIYVDYISKNKDDISIDHIVLVADVLKKISLSNSTEIVELRSSLATQILATENPMESFEKVEQEFLKTNIPTVGKIFSVFEILHPKFSGFDFSDYSMVSPMLKSNGNLARRIMVFSDLVRASLGSNNRTMINYVNNLKNGSALYEELKQNPERILTVEEEKTLKVFISHLKAMYLKSFFGINVNDLPLTGNYLDDIEYIKKLISPDGSMDYDLADRLVDMFCHFAGFSTLEQIESYMKKKVSDADSRNGRRTTISIEKGDFIKGINDVKYLGQILQNGSVSKEYLGAYSSSDQTPLDTDLSMVLINPNDIEEAIQSVAAKSYGSSSNSTGSIWFVLKQDDRFAFTRRSPNDPDQSIDENVGFTKFETFYTGVCGYDHYGIRTGFSSSDIDYIVTEPYDKRVGLEIVLNGFYIPVFDKKGNLVFSQEDYDLLRRKMSGLSYYNSGEYVFSDDLIVPGVEDMASKLPASIDDIMIKRKAINAVVSEVLAKYGLTLKDHFDGDLTEGSAELIDTGSTGRYTNMPGDGDFDFMLKLDKRIKENPELLEALKKDLLKAFNKEHHEKDEIIDSGDFRLKKVHLSSLPMTVDIDISFETKTDKVQYSTDEALKDRLANMKKQDNDKYLLVVSNILLAKELLKMGEVYKNAKNRDNPQGGLGGVGVENWIIQNGGSLKKAAESFLECAKGKDFEQFRKSYVIWDFGQNHFVTRQNIYPYDDFVYNMSSAGYYKMKKVLIAFLNTLGYSLDGSEYGLGEGTVEETENVGQKK